jgi:DNA ligase-1
MSEARDLSDGETAKVHGSGSSVYTLRNSGGIYSCTCPAWMHQSTPIERRTCKHLRAFRGDDAETTRVGESAPSAKPSSGKSSPSSSADAPPLLLAHKWELDVDLTGWWMSEKLDGVRAYWNGTHFVSRLGNRFFAPSWFVAGLPDTPLDGELFGGRKRFQRTVGVVKRQDESDAWKELRFVVFDAPSHGGVFEERLEHCQALLASAAAPYAEYHPHVVCKGEPHMREELARIEALGGEGLMMRKPKSRYEVGRSATLLKVKTFHDAEAIVVGHVAGAGKHKGRLGALVVETPDGTRFNVGTGYSDHERENPPLVGTIITYRYQELSDGGVPRFPTYVGVRADAEWTGRPPESIDAAPIEGRLRRFEKSDGESRTFYEIEVRGSSCYVRWGTFDEKTHTYESHEDAFQDAERRIVEQLAAGFAEVRDAASAEPEDDESASAQGDATREAEGSASPEVASAQVPSEAEAGARYFELVDGTSRKFWEITLDGAKVTTRYGKIGASGQQTAKDHGTPERARLEHDKLIAEKTKKGYVEKPAP